MFEAAAVKNEAGRGNLSTPEGRAAAPVGAGGVEAAAPYGTCEAGRDGIDAASPLAGWKGRMEASRIGERERRQGERERGDVRRDFPLAAGSCFPVKPPPTTLTATTTPSLPPPSLVFDALQRCRLHFSLLFLFPARSVSPLAWKKMTERR